MNSLGVFIKEKREKLGLSQADIAKKLGYSSAQFISNCERGLASFPIAHATKLAKMLKIGVNDIIFHKTQDKAAQYARQTRTNGTSKKRVSRL